MMLMSRSALRVSLLPVQARLLTRLMSPAPAPVLAVVTTTLLLPSAVCSADTVTSESAGDPLAWKVVGPALAELSVPTIPAAVAVA